MDSLSGNASFTTYTSYAACCPSNPNYNSSADSTECDDYSACDYSGDFAAIGHKSYEYVQSHNLVAFFDASDANGYDFEDKYGGKRITLRKGNVSLTAIIADTCSDSDCDGCCTQNAKPFGYLLDMEYWTVINNFGTMDAADGQIAFYIEDGQDDALLGDDGGNDILWIWIVGAILASFMFVTVIGFVIIIKSRRKKRISTQTVDQHTFTLMTDQNLNSQ